METCEQEPYLPLEVAVLETSNASNEENLTMLLWTLLRNFNVCVGCCYGAYVSDLEKLNFIRWLPHLIEYRLVVKEFKFWWEKISFISYVCQCEWYKPQYLFVLPWVIGIRASEGTLGNVQISIADRNCRRNSVCSFLLLFSPFRFQSDCASISLSSPLMLSGTSTKAKTKIHDPTMIRVETTWLALNNSDIVSSRWASPLYLWILFLS